MVKSSRPTPVSGYGSEVVCGLPLGPGTQFPYGPLEEG